MMYRMDSRLSLYGREIDQHDNEMKRSIDALTNAISLLSSRLDKIEDGRVSGSPRGLRSARVSSQGIAVPLARPKPATVAAKPSVTKSSFASGATARPLKASVSTTSIQSARAHRASTSNLNASQQRQPSKVQKKTSDRASLSASKGTSSSQGKARYST
jgi:hypothetical protein